MKNKFLFYVFESCFKMLAVIQIVPDFQFLESFAYPYPFQSNNTHQKQSLYAHAYTHTHTHTFHGQIKEILKRRRKLLVTSLLIIKYE